MVKVKQPQIKRGQLWVADLDPGFGRELRKKRPAIIISSDIINRYSPTIIILPITSQISPTRPDKIDLSRKESNLNKDSAVLTDQIRAIDKSRLVKEVGLLSKNKLTEIEEALKVVLGIEEID